MEYRQAVQMTTALCCSVLLAACDPQQRPQRPAVAASQEASLAEDLQREREAHPQLGDKAAEDWGRLEVSTGSLLTDGRNLRVRGTLRNPFPQPVEGVRVVFEIYAGGPAASARPLDTVQEEKAIRIAPGDTAPLRLDVQTMYAADNRFLVAAFAKRVGDREIAPPPGWRE